MNETFRDLALVQATRTSALIAGALRLLALFPLGVDAHGDVGGWPCSSTRIIGAVIGDSSGHSRYRAPR